MDRLILTICKILLKDVKKGGLFHYQSGSHKVKESGCLLKWKEFNKGISWVEGARYTVGKKNCTGKIIKKF